MWNSDDEIAAMLVHIARDDTGIQWEELYQKNEQELLEAGLIKGKNGTFLIPTIYNEHIPEGMVLTSRNGKDKIRYIKWHENAEDMYYGGRQYGINISDPDCDKLTIEEPKSFEEYFKTMDLSRLLRDERECVESLIENDVLLTTAKQLFERLKVYKKIKSEELFDETRTIFDIEDFSRAKLIREGKRAYSVDEGIYARKDGSDKFRFGNWDDLFDMVKEAEKVNGDISAVFAGAKMYAGYLGDITEKHKAEEKYQLYQTYKQFKKEAPDLCALLERRGAGNKGLIYCNREDKYNTFVTLVKYPEVVKTLLHAKDNDGSPLFDPFDIVRICAHKKESIKYHQDKIKKVLSNPEEIDRIVNCEDRGIELWQCIKSPLQSAKEQNPQTAEDKSQVISEGEDTAKTNPVKARIKKIMSKIRGEKTPPKNNEPDKSSNVLEHIINKIKDRRKH
ncbi:MAG: hypothetical protein E7019_04100 [Alphaproteobacteria bacterium]|nr:hypothetical protein [Alphaproteobacteria bacterium]